MCGVAGIVSLDQRPVRDAEARIARMTMMLKHRGPDSQGTYVSPDGLCALGNTRLAIVDPHNPIKQPLETQDGQCVLSFNGEIYNFEDVRVALNQKGILFRTHMDTEVLLEGLRLEGEDFLQRLDGMWAFAQYDRRERRLLLSRDLMGEKHLYYYVNGNEFIFCSEVKPILTIVDRFFEVDFDGFLTSLQYFAPAPQRTMVRGVHRLLPGHNIKVDLVTGNVKQTRYRKLQPEKWFDFFAKQPSTNEVVEVFEEMFYKVCKRRLTKEVPFICTLSGGLDSTVICTYASDYGRIPIKTIYGQSDEKPAQNLGDELDEYTASQITSRILNTEHDHIFLNSDDSIPVFKRLADDAFDGMYDSGVAAFEMIARYTRDKQIKVMLMAEGPDEFLGYPKDLYAYGLDQIYQQNSFYYKVLQMVSSSKRGRELLCRWGRADLVIPRFFSHHPFQFIPIHESWGADVVDRFLTDEQIVSTSRHYGTLDPIYQDLTKTMDFTQLRALSYATLSLPEMFNLRTDKAYMNASVEARLPYQAPEMVEWMVAIPARLRFQKGEKTKYFLRKVVERHVGPQIAHRSKHEFAVPTWKSPNVFKAMRYRQVVADSSIFKDFPFPSEAREFILHPENYDMLWPFFVLARINDQLKRRSYQRSMPLEAALASIV